MTLFKARQACGFLLISLAACTQENTSETSSNMDIAEGERTTVSPDNSAYQKPGASVRFSHDFDGRLEPGQPETISLVFAEAYQAGSLSLSFTADDGLEYSLIEAGVFDLQSASRHGLDIELSALNPGRYYLRIFAEVILPQGRPDRRVFGLVAEVGNEESKTEVDSQTMEKDFRGGDLITMPAEETLKK